MTWVALFWTSHPCGNASASRRSGCRNWLPRMMPSLGLSPKTMPSTCAEKSVSSVVPECRPGSRPSAMYALHLLRRDRPARDAWTASSARRGGCRSPRPAATSVVSIPATPRGIPSGLGRVLHAQPVGLQLVVASVLQEEHAQRGLGGALQRPRLGNEDAEQRETDAGARRLRVLLRRVARRDVTDLVAEHAGKLRLVVEKRQDAARHVDVAAGKREGVDRGLVHDREVPRQLRAAATPARASCPTPST